MADAKITGLSALSEAPADGDLIEIVDVSDTTMAATGTNKKITAANLLANAGGGGEKVSFSTIFESVSSRYTLTQSNSGTVVANANGVRLATNSGNTAVAALLLVDVVYSTAGFNWWDRNPKFTVCVRTMTSTAGNGLQAFGMRYGGNNMDHTDIYDKGFWFVREISSGTSTVYACVSNGSAVGAEDITSDITLSAESWVFSAQMTSGTDVKFYINGTLVATITTGLPSGEADGVFRARCSNSAGDTTARILDLSSLKIEADL